MKRNNLYLSLILVVFTLFSCTHRSYRMQTQVNRDGSCVRSISVETRDSAFIAGDTTANPLPIQLDTTWTVECYNGQQKVTWPVKFRFIPNRYITPPDNCRFPSLPVSRGHG